MTDRRMSRLSSSAKRKDSEELNNLKQEYSIDAHLRSPEQLAIKLKSDLIKGVSHQDASDRLQTDGLNRIGDAVTIDYMGLLIDNIFGMFPLLLWVGAALSFFIYGIQHVTPGPISNENLYLGAVIVLVILSTGLFGFYEEARTASVMASFQKLIPKSARIIREGEKLSVAVENIVMGDIVEVRSGEMVPADIRIIKSSNFKIDMSSITGETLPQLRTPDYTNENPLETQNLAFFSCNVLEGDAVGIVVATGAITVIGRIASLTTALKKERTPIEEEINTFVKIIACCAVTCGLMLLITTVCIGMSWISGVYYMIGLVLGNMPEGLLITLTVTFTLSAKRLKDNNCAVKHLKAVETLGSTTVICSDKTGTLTQNKMSVSHFAYNNIIVDADDQTLRRGDSYRALAFAATLCLRAEFDDPVDKTKGQATGHITGDASEAAILKFMEEHHDATVLRKANPKLCEIPFNSNAKYQVSIHRHNDKHILVMKGAPEIILGLCTTIMLDGQASPLGNTRKSDVESLWIQLGHMGERVLGYCDRLLDPIEYPEGFQFNSEKINFPTKDFRFLGLVALIDPPRAAVPEAIRKCKSAGIKVFMVTGDHPTTALAISRKCGIISEDHETLYDRALRTGKKIPEETFISGQKNMKAAVITGQHLKCMTTDMLDELIERVGEITFARTSPQQKLLIVEACQRLGHVVAVTGDGVNDSPALKKADTGIAMGITGTDVSKDAADIILLDDNFASIVLGIEQGRLIFDNLKKSIAYTISSNIAEMAPFVLFAVLGVPLPLQVLLIICIDVGTDLFPAMSLAYERSELDIMKRPPRSLYGEILVNSKLILHSYGHVGIIEAMSGFCSYLTIMAMHGFFPGDIMFTRLRWSNEMINDFQDYYGQEWTFYERKHLEMMAQCAYFVGLLEGQLCNLIACKTRRLSILHQGCYNRPLLCGMVMAILLACLVVYVPFCNYYMYTRPVPALGWLSGLPFGAFIIIMDETRKALFRKYPGIWLNTEIGY